MSHDTVFSPSKASGGVHEQIESFLETVMRGVIGPHDQQVATEQTGKPGRPIPAGMPAYNDENMIMLSAAAKVAAPALAAKFDADSRDFHAALAKDRASAVRAGLKAPDPEPAFKGALGLGRLSRFSGGATASWPCAARGRSHQTLRRAYLKHARSY